MMLMRIKIILVSLLLASCSWFTPHKLEIRQGNLLTKDMIAKVKIGMSPSQVKLILGTPLINDLLHANRWDYVYRFVQEGKLVEEKRLVLYFENDSLKRMDDSLQSAPAQNADVAAPQKNENQK